MRSIITLISLGFVGLGSAPASADAFELISGTWGLIDHEELSCEVNPHRISFTPDRKRALFTWDKPMLSYTGDWLIEGGYDVIAVEDNALTMALDGERRRTEADEPVVWILRVSGNGNRYCWGREDWSPDDCIDRYQRCPGPVPVS